MSKLTSDERTELEELRRLVNTPKTPLSDHEINEIWLATAKFIFPDLNVIRKFCRQVEAAHGIAIGQQSVFITQAEHELIKLKKKAKRNGNS